ncbi:enoyl-CoA delta isomerase 3, peroxisomal isoform X2 [Ptiloglossa arizonensis]|uniref:enoyl-CoA delta isomerase 3, peroxisomal isoform X2 n=1 Tax=Ptiloglossa arizonensis TaxID=3350558 RepID=UPI003FA12E4F
METKNSSNILYFMENGIQKIVLNRPEKKNAIDVSMYAKLSQILHESIQDNNIHMVVLTGIGDYFSSGNDFVSLTMDSIKDSVDIESKVSIYKNFVDILITYPKLLVAIVNGSAIGIAVTMLPLFDMASFHTPFTSLGLVAEGCSTYTFPKIFGHSKAGDMLYLGYKMNAIEAKHYGLISEVYEQKDLDNVWTYLKTVSMLSIESVLATKRLVKRWNEKILLDVNTQESVEIVKCVQSSDFIERFTNMKFHKSKI